MIKKKANEWQVLSFCFDLYNSVFSGLLCFISLWMMRDGEVLLGIPFLARQDLGIRAHVHTDPNLV
jgi:hypothetical protein